MDENSLRSWTRAARHFPLFFSMCLLILVNNLLIFVLISLLVKN